MKFTDLFIQRPVLASVISLLILVVGLRSIAALDLRVRAACSELVERAAESNVVVVSHVSPMKSAVAWALGVDIGISWTCHLDHASVCRIAFRNGTPILTTFNETAELPR